MTDIHSTAIIEKGAEIANDVKIGPYAFIGKDVRIDSRCVISAHATVSGNTTLGKSNEVYSYAYIGGKTHDLKYSGGNPKLKIGDGNVFREYTSIHTATFESGETIIGNKNYFLAYAHVGHDCILGDSIVMSCGSMLGGHVQVGNHVTIGGNVAIHQFCKLGEYSMIGGQSCAVQDVLPFMLADGNLAVTKTFNSVGLERKGFSVEDRMLVKRIYKTIFRSGLNKTQAIEQMKVLENSLVENEKQMKILKTVVFAMENTERGFV